MKECQVKIVYGIKCKCEGHFQGIDIVRNEISAVRQLAFISSLWQCVPNKPCDWACDNFNTFAASYLNTQGLNNSCLKSPVSTLVDLTFQSHALRSFSLNQLRNLSL